MDERRLRYLKALDIDVWQRRHPSSDGGAAPDATLPARTGPRAGATPADWTALEQAVRECVQCGLHATRTQTVFGAGNRAAEWMVIGEAPGADEDREGKPFVGRAGQLLTAMLAAMGLPREQVFIANILKCRPPGNRDPAPAEVASCLPYLLAQIERVDPRLILCVGRIAAQNLLGTDAPLGKLRGRLHSLPGSGRPVVVTYHPAYLLRTPVEKRRAWEDLVFALRTADGLARAGHA